MKRKMIIIMLIGLLTQIGYAVPQIPESYKNEMIGEWYCNKYGYLLSITTSADPTELDAKLINYNTVVSDSVLEMTFSILMDPENEHYWYSSDGTMKIERYYNDDPKSLWIRLREYNSFLNSEGGLYSFTYISEEKQKQAEEISSTDPFVGEWIDESNGELFSISYLPASQDIYGYRDYLVKYNAGQIVLNLQDGNKLDRYIDPQYDGYMYLASPKNIEIKDKNNMVIKYLNKKVAAQAIDKAIENSVSRTEERDEELDQFYDSDINDIDTNIEEPDEQTIEGILDSNDEVESDKRAQNTIDEILNSVNKYIGPSTFIGALLIGIIIAIVEGKVNKKKKKKG